MDKLEVGKWVFLWVVLGQVGSLTVALCMRLMGRLEGKYENMELEEANRLHDLELQGISNSITASQKVTNRNEDKWGFLFLQTYPPSFPIHIATP